MAESIVASKPITPSKPPLVFEFSAAAARQNWETISAYGSLDNLIRFHNRSTIGYGSEFRPTATLEPLLRQHKDWMKLKCMLDNGSKFPLTAMDEETASKDLREALQYGNHQSARMNEDVLFQHLSKELSKGWIIPLLPEHAFLIKNASLAPLGVVSQSTINDKGEIIASNRVTHDLSFPGKISNSSVNSRTIMDELEPCKYGHMLLRTIYYIIALRIRNPNLPIMLQKIDFKSAYRRQHLNAETATQCLSCTEVEGQNLLLMNLHLSFGGQLAQPNCV